MNWVSYNGEAVLNNLHRLQRAVEPQSNAIRQASLCTLKQSRHSLPVTPVYLYHILSRKNKLSNIL